MAASKTRKRLVVDKLYQVPFASRIVLLMFALTTGSFLVAMSILWRHLHHPELAARYYVIAGLMGCAMTLLIELILMVPILYYYGLRQSHRVVGPVKRIIHALRAIGKGDYSRRLTLRPGDVLGDVAGAINEMADELERRVGSPPRRRDLG
jgi:nitrate/nitrite-specific signal transduction histidine kinase